MYVYIYIYLFCWKDNDFRTPRRKTMQNHYETTSKSKFWTQNVWNWIKNLASVMSGPTLHSIELRNTQGKIHATYLGNIYGIDTEYIRNIHKHLWYKIIRNTDPMGRPPKAAPVFLIILCHKYLWIFLIHSLYIPHTYIYIYIYIYTYIS